MTTGVLDGKVAIVTGAAMGDGRRYEIRQMLAQGTGGAIVNIGSVSSFRPQPESAAYVAAKHGVLGLTKVASLESAAPASGSTPSAPARSTRR
jgi:hypothetical protein